MFIFNSSLSLDLLCTRGPLGTTLEFRSVMAGAPLQKSTLPRVQHPYILSETSFLGSVFTLLELVSDKVCFLREVRKRTVPSRWQEADLPLKERLSRLAHKRELQLLSWGRWGKKKRCSPRTLSGYGPTAFSTDCEMERFSSHRRLCFLVSCCSDRAKRVRLHRLALLSQFTLTCMIRARQSPAWWYSESKNWVRV